MEYSFNIGEQLIDYFKNWLKSDDGQDIIRQAVKEYLKEESGGGNWIVGCYGTPTEYRKETQ